jgi:hypothetical protein
MQIREVRLTGPTKADASVHFKAGGNVITGDSDTGKSYILQCIDYVLGAEKPPKSIEEAVGYKTVFVEFEGGGQSALTLQRPLGGGDIEAHRAKIDNIVGRGEVVPARRYGKSLVRDVTSVVLEFSQLSEAQLRSTKEGKPARLSLRHLAPIVLVSETSIIAELSPVYTNSGYEQTISRRMFSYLLTGLDDSGTVAEEKREIVQAGARGKVALIDTLMQAIEERLQQAAQDKPDGEDLAVERVDAAIETMTLRLTADNQERAHLQTARRQEVVNLQRAESQIIALDELLIRYRLLDNRYESDLKRLDFMAEGGHFFDALQEVRCPFCDQPMDSGHQQHLDENGPDAYVAAKSEAAKILGLRADLALAYQTLISRRSDRETERAKAHDELAAIDGRIATELTPALQEVRVRLDALIKRRLTLEAIKSDREQARALEQLKQQLERELNTRQPPNRIWSALEPATLHEFCLALEETLRSWAWKSRGQVSFDENEKVFDVRIDGKPRQSHGKGVRAILHAAFATSLMRYCKVTEKPHPGFVVLDSPLTTLKKGEKAAKEEKLDPTMEAAFWQGIAALPDSAQVIVLENKEPAVGLFGPDVYTFFAGENAQSGERVGFIPV